LRKDITGTAAGRDQNVQGKEQNPFSNAIHHEYELLQLQDN